MNNPIVAFMPCYNEAASITTAIEKLLEAGVQWVIVTNDGSRDNSLEVLESIAKKTGRVFVLNFKENRGVSAGKITGFALAWQLYRSGFLPESALLVKLDSDGQHDPAYIPEMADILQRRGLDFLLSYRDFSVYPFFKVVGNVGLSLIASAMTGFWFRDSMSGLKIMRMSVLGEILSYFTGFRYAASQEIAMIPVLRGFRTANDYPVKIPIYKSGCGVQDGWSVLRMGFICWWRVLTGKRENPDQKACALLTDPNTVLAASPAEIPAVQIFNPAAASAASPNF